MRKQLPIVGDFNNLSFQIGRTVVSLQVKRNWKLLPACFRYKICQIIIVIAPNPQMLIRPLRIEKNQVKTYYSKSHLVLIIMSTENKMLMLAFMVTKIITKINLAKK